MGNFGTGLSWINYSLALKSNKNKNNLLRAKHINTVTDETKMLKCWNGIPGKI